MAVTFGFYNAKNHDRKYNAMQLSSIFDGIVRDGVFMSIGTCFNVKPSVGMSITVGTGRAWFNHTWTLNDSLLPFTLKNSDRLGYRMDLVVLEVDASSDVRRNRIYILEGETGSTPIRPTFTNTATKHSYVLAEITIDPGVTQIMQSKITNRVGMGDCPFVTGVLDTVNIDRLVAQWEAQWDEFYIEHTTEMISTSRMWEEQWRTWFTAQANNLNAAYLDNINKFNTAADQTLQEMTDVADEYTEKWTAGYEAFYLAQQEHFANFVGVMEAKFQELYDRINAIPVTGDLADVTKRLEHAERLNEIQNIRWNELLRDHSVTDGLQDTNDDYIQDSNGNLIGTRVVFEIVYRPPRVRDIHESDLFYIECDDEEADT